ncbi:MAG TPA: thymidine phosphorylase [Verrucomicrobiae bacterium]|nr:thymidine phosphorylase [Verrucomicrobiae bacterium]
MPLPAQIIQKKRDGHALTEEEIRFFINGFTSSELPDYQMSALAMAVCFQGMNFDETMWLTRAMIESGKVVEWRKDSAQVPKGPSASASKDSGTHAPGHPNTGFHADKHSTGGIGDKTSLIIAPLVAACGVKVPMISGRGLGPTGGTLDKLESIAGFNVNLSLDEFQRITEKVGCCMIGQTAEIAPADKKLYALRDVTATVSCLPLIVASIMCKKLAENVDGLVLDVKWGSGAFMRTRDSSAELARAMVEVGKRYGKKVVALQTDMNQPLGQKIGNALEVRECIELMSSGAGVSPANQTKAAGTAAPLNDLLEVTLALAAEMLLMAGAAKNVAEARRMMQKKLASGEALRKFAELIAAQGGDARVCDDVTRLPAAKYTRPIPAPNSGFVQSIECDQIGYAVIALGGGRKLSADKIDFAVGFEQPKKIGDAVKAGDALMVMHYNDEARAAEAERMVQQAYTIADKPVSTRLPLIVQKIE